MRRYTVHLEVRLEGDDAPWEQVAQSLAKQIKRQVTIPLAKAVVVKSVEVDTADEL